MSSFWFNGNGYFVIEGGKAIRCETCPCISYLTKLQLEVLDGNLGTPELIEVDMTLGTMTSLNLVLYYLGTEYGVQMEITPNGPAFVCGTNREELTFDFKFITETPSGESDVYVLTTFVPEINILCVEPFGISRIPYEDTLETHTAYVSHCDCPCLDENVAFEGTLTINTVSGPIDPVPLFDPVDPVDPDTTEIRFRVRYCYERCPEPPEEE